MNRRTAVMTARCLTSVLMLFVGLLMSPLHAMDDVAGACASASRAPRPGLTPPAKLVKLNGGMVRWSGEVLGDVGVVGQYAALRKQIPSSKNGVPLHVEVADSLEGVADAEALTHEEGYVLRTSPSSISLTAHDGAGIARGLTELDFLAATHSGKIPEGELVDWPSLSVRALHFVAKGDISVDDLCRMVDLASAAKFNRIIVVVTPTIGLSSFGSAARGARVSAGQFSDFVSHAESMGLQVIPELKLLTHQEKFLGKSRPDILYNESTYDPRKPATYKAVFPIIDQVMQVTHSKILLIGHDEVSGWNPKRPVLSQIIKGESMIPADLFMQDTIRVDNYLRSKGDVAWMWGDMLLSPASAPGANQNYLHGRKGGYGERLLDSLPKDIVICDWQYKGGIGNFRTLGLIGRKGFGVLGATWFDSDVISNFSDYAIKQKARGMIATTWFLFQRHQWDRIETLVGDSGKAYWGSGTSQK